MRDRARFTKTSQEQRGVIDERLHEANAAAGFTVKISVGASPKSLGGHLRTQDGSLMDRWGPAFWVGLAGAPSQFVAKRERTPG